MILRYMAVQLLAIFIFFSLSFADVCNDADCAKEAKPYAWLSNIVYTKGLEGNGWELVRNKKGEIIDFEWDFGCYHYMPSDNYINCILSGFYAALYRKINTNEYVLAFRGTNDLGDLDTDIRQYLGLTNFLSFNDQYDKAVYAVDSVEGLLPSNAKLTLTGHSLGGGLATWAAHKRGLKAYVFNTARIGYVSKKFLPNTEDCSVNSYIARDDSVESQDVVSDLGTGTDLTTDYLVLIPDDWGDFYSPAQLHRINLINAALIYYSNSSEQVTPPSPSPSLQSWQENYISSPGGAPIIQSVWGLTPGGTATLQVEYIEQGTVEDISISAKEIDSKGHWSVSYYPTVNKPIGHYQWWMIDGKTDKQTEKIPYQIVRPYTEGETPWYGNYGEEIVDTAPPPPECLPDFVAKRAWITKSENGEDKYVFEVGDTPWINVKVKNEGCADSPQDINVWYLLSKGEKEDNHHDWEKIGTDTIRDYELPVGQDKWEKEEFTVPDEPGKYNIVACADRIALYDNGDGDVYEEHKSNDCSTEAVFTVLPKDNPPEGYFESATCDSLDGWAKDPDTSSSVFIRFYKDGPADTGTYIGSTFADNYRGDLPYDDKEHGFSFNLPDSLNDGVEHQVYAYAIDDAGGTNTLLTNSPKMVKCGLTADELAAVLSVIENVIFADDEVEKKGWLPAIFKILLLAN